MEATKTNKTMKTYHKLIFGDVENMKELEE